MKIMLQLYAARGLKTWWSWSSPSGWCWWQRSRWSSPSSWLIQPGSVEHNVTKLCQTWKESQHSCHAWLCFCETISESSRRQEGWSDTVSQPVSLKYYTVTPWAAQYQAIRTPLNWCSLFCVHFSLFISVFIAFYCDTPYFTVAKDE